MSQPLLLKGCGMYPAEHTTATSFSLYLNWVSKLKYEYISLKHLHNTLLSTKHPFLQLACNAVPSPKETNLSKQIEFYGTAQPCHPSFVKGFKTLWPYRTTLEELAKEFNFFLSKHKPKVRSNILVCCWQCWLNCSLYVQWMWRMKCALWTLQPCSV